MSVTTEQSFELNSVDYADDNVYVMSTSPFQDAGTPRVNRAQLSQANGEVTQGATYEAKEIVLECAIIDVDDADDLDTKIANVVTAYEAAHAGGETALVLGRYPDKTYQARPIPPAPSFARGVNGAIFTITLLASDPVPT